MHLAHIEQLPCVCVCDRLLCFSCYGLGYFVSLTSGYSLSTVVNVVLGVGFSITSGLAPRLDVVKNWWPLPIFWYVPFAKLSPFDLCALCVLTRVPVFFTFRSLSYNRWGGEAVILLMTRASRSAPEELVDRALVNYGVNPDNFNLDLGMLVVIGVMWRLFAYLRLRFARAAV